MTFYEAPFPPYDPRDKNGFSYDTVVRRWPVILTSVNDFLHNTCQDLASKEQEARKSGDTEGADILRKKIEQGNRIISKVSDLKEHMAGNRALEDIPEDGETHTNTYNEELAQLAKVDNNTAKVASNTWFTAPWLYAEYRLLRSYFTQATHWSDVDPFSQQKFKAFRQSGNSIYKIATTMHELEIGKDTIGTDPEKLGILFTEMIQMCLWGNATDLSLLTHLTPSDIAHIQSVGKEAQASRREFILRDDQQAVWNHVMTLRNARIDFILDNSGFELFTDLVFADFLVTYTQYVSKVVFHPKLIPWFVSDVLPADFAQSIELLADHRAFFGLQSEKDGVKASQEHLEALITRWKKYIQDGTFSLSVPLTNPLGSSATDTTAKLAEFWTTPWPYWDMKLRAPEVFEHLSGSGLVIFKGDLNYRKLTGDIKWDAWTDFSTALGPLAGSFPLLSLRTNKADVVVGVERSVAEALDQSGEKWRVDGRYALISFLPASGSQ